MGRVYGGRDSLGMDIMDMVGMGSGAFIMAPIIIALFIIFFMSIASEPDRSAAEDASRRQKETPKGFMVCLHVGAAGSGLNWLSSTECVFLKR